MDVRKLKDKAQEAYGKRRFDKAAELYAEVCEADPKDLSTRQRWGDALRQAGRTKQATEVYQRTADAYAQDGQLLKAIAVNKLLLEVDPSHTATQAKLAELYAKRAPPPSVAGQSARTERLEATRRPEPPSPSERHEASRLTPLEDLSVERVPEGTDLDLNAAISAADAAVPAVDLARPAVGEGAMTGVFEIALDDDPLEVSTANPAADETLARIPDSPLFEQLDPGAFVDLLQSCTRRVFNEGDVLLTQGEPARSFFVVSSGILAVVQSPPSDPTQLQELARLGPGDFFGELALVSESPRIASVVATTEGEALEFPGVVLARLIADHPSAEAAVNKFTRARLLQNAMATSGLFRPFDRDQRKHLIARFVIREVPQGTAVLTEGQPSDGLYVVMQGRYAVDHGGQRLATLRVGEIFGEISLLSREGAGATVTAETRGRVLRLPRKSFDELILTHPQVLEMVSNLADERRQLNEGVASGRVSCDTEGLILM